MPFTAAHALLEIVSNDPTVWIGAGIALLLFGIFTIRGFLATVSEITAGIAAWRRTPPNRRTMTVARIKANGDYRAATPAERAALGKLDPATELVENAHFLGHTAAVAREIVGEDRSKEWPYRHINLEEAAEDLRASYASIRIGPTRYWYGAD